jgi:hypothetical protein
MSFKTQAATKGITNANQGIFDFSEREFDIDGGGAWNYYRSFEFRLFAYSFNNLNRGTSKITSSGYNDGVGLENRYYFSSDYQQLGSSVYDLPRAGFFSVGYYPTKTMTDASGYSYKPGLFLHGCATFDVLGPQFYLYGEADVIFSHSLQPRVSDIDVGVAARPLPWVPRFEVRVGAQEMLDIQDNDHETRGCFALRYIF